MKEHENHAFSKKIEPSQLNSFVKNVDSSTSFCKFFFNWSKLCWRAFELALGKLVQLKNVIFFLSALFLLKVRAWCKTEKK